MLDIAKILYMYVHKQNWKPRKSNKFSIPKHLVLNQRSCTPKSSIGGINKSRVGN